MKKQTIVVAVCALLLGLIAVPALALAGDGVAIDSTVMIPHKAISYDANGDGQAQPEELIGEYDVYNAGLLLSSHWETVPGATFYRVELIQYERPGKEAPAPSTVARLSHHSASDPNGPAFNLSVTNVCLDCVSYIRVTPETMTLAEDGVTRIYTPFDTGVQVSKLFVLELLPASRTSGVGGFGPLCGDGICTAAENILNGPYWCEADCGAIP